MKVAETNASLQIDSSAIHQYYDREPFGFEHTLSECDLFRTDSLFHLAELYEAHPGDYFVAGSAPTPGTRFYAVPSGKLKPLEALENLAIRPNRVLLKRPENHDARFRELLDHLFQYVVSVHGGLGGEKVVRLESSILISSASTTTPIHFDPEIGFFSQIEGNKTYHVFSPTVVSEEQLEAFYSRGVVDICQLRLEDLDPSKEHVFHLAPGKGMHQPQNAPHWVETGSTRSISFTFVFETDKGRLLNRTRAFNHYLRRVGVAPPAIGAHQSSDALKARTMKTAMPMQKLARRAVRKVLGK